MHNPLLGIYYLAAGFNLIFKPGLRRFIVVPLFINIAIFIGLFFLMRVYMSEFNSWFTHYLPTWLYWLSGFLWFLFFISFFLVFVYSFVAITNVIAAPFNSVLAEKVEIYLTGKALPKKKLRENITDVPRAIFRQLAILGYYLPRVAFILLLFFIPVIQTVATFLWFLFNAWVTTLMYIDFPSDNHRVSLREVHIFLKQKRLLSLSFGVSVLIVAMIPILNFFIIPAACAGATKLWIEEYNRKNEEL